MARVSDYLRNNKDFIAMQTKAKTNDKYVLEFANGEINVEDEQDYVNSNNLKKVRLGDNIEKIKKSNGGTINNTYAVVKMKDCVEYLEFLNSSLPHGKLRNKTLEQNTYLDHDYLCILGALKDINFIPENIADLEDRGKGKSNGKGKGQQIKVEYNDYAIEILKYAIDKRGRNSKVNGKTTPPVPILTRQAIYAVTYNTVSGIHSKSNKSNSPDKMYSVVKNNRRRFIYANYENIILNRIGLSDNKLNKWGMYPVRDYEHETTEPVLLKVYRNGRKRDDLLFTLSRLINDDYPRRFIDVFGGTGVVTAALPKKKVEILNEFDPFTFIFLKCVQKDAKKVLDICRGMHKELVDFDLNDPNNADWVKLGRTRRPVIMKGVDPNFFLRYQSYAYKLLYGYKEEEYSKSIKSCQAIQNMEDLEKTYEHILFRYAAIWYFLHSFPSSNASNNPDMNCFTMKNYPDYLKKLGFINLQLQFKDKSVPYIYELRDTQHYPNFIHNSIVDNPDLFTVKKINGAIEGKDYKFTDDVELIRFGKRLKYVSLRNESFETILDEADKFASVGGKTVEKVTDVKDRRSILATPKQTVVYLDPPYFLTAQYNNPFPDSYHMIMLGWMRNTECRWVMSCKDSITNISSDQDYRYGIHPDAPLIKSFKTYFEILGYGYGKEINENTGKVYYVKDSKNNKLMENLYVYKNVDEQYNEIMITNFYIEEVGREIFDLYWNANISSAPNREKKISKKNYQNTPFFIREDYLSFLSRI